ncbi:hypothetical protein Taro_040854 [Colocasia esculenta]|uniref:Cupin type-1 domain-containing protein n=1 Tax=Colocasia esculenta TaxID=4460 RepID=A0A843WA06_COLES|nr:hypothetical protein [Colocasia esculenta]
MWHTIAATSLSSWCSFAPSSLYNPPGLFYASSSPHPAPFISASLAGIEAMARFSSRAFPVGAAIFVCLLLAVADLAASSNQGSQEEAPRCRFRRLSANRPFRRIQSEGGYTELWNENDKQFKCAGVAAMRNTLRPQCLSLPNYSPQPRLVYIQKGQGLIGMSYSGCPETFHSGEEYSYSRRTEEREGPREEEHERSQKRDQHQKIHRIRQGDIVAFPPGVTHWCYNDGNEDLVAFSITDVNSQWNQIGPTPRSFYLAGGPPKESETMEPARDIHAVNMIRPFDAELLATAFNVPAEIVRTMQREDERGLIVRVKKGSMEMMRPTEEERERRERDGRREEEEEVEEGRRKRDNGVEEIYCSSRIHHYLDNPGAADVYSRQAGWLHSIDVFKLPILRYLGLSAEKTNLRPNAISSPHWNNNFHTIALMTRGEGQVQVVDGEGRSLFNDRVREGDVLVIPQNFAIVSRAGNNGVEWVAFKTSATPTRSPIAGKASVFMGLPAQVIANAYRLSLEQAQQLKYNREDQSMLFPSGRASTAD